MREFWPQMHALQTDRKETQGDDTSWQMFEIYCSIGGYFLFYFTVQVVYN
jgi:hypothetical protein